MVYLDFALALYPQQRTHFNDPYVRDHRTREEEWGLLKLLLGTTYAQLEADLRLLAGHLELTVLTYEAEMVRVYRCESLRWDDRYPEAKRIVQTANEIARKHDLCMEFLGIHQGDVCLQDSCGLHSFVLQRVQTIKVDV